MHNATQDLQDLGREVSEEVELIHSLKERISTLRSDLQGLTVDVPRLEEALAGLDVERRSLEQKRQGRSPTYRVQKRCDELKRTDDLKKDILRLRQYLATLDDHEQRIEAGLQASRPSLEDINSSPRDTRTDNAPTGTVQRTLDEIMSQMEIIGKSLVIIKKGCYPDWQTTSAIINDLIHSTASFCHVRPRQWPTRKRSITIISSTEIHAVNRTFKFNLVLGPGTRNPDLFAGLRLHARGLLDQRNIHLFCYGAVNAQESTLFGKNNKGADHGPGLLALLLEHTFHLLDCIINSDRTIARITMSSFYVCGDEIRDCFSGREMDPPTLPSSSSSSSSAPLFNLKQETVPDISQGEKLLAQAAAFHRKRSQVKMSHWGVQFNLVLVTDPSQIVRFTIISLATESTDALRDLGILESVLDEITESGKLTKAKNSTVGMPLDRHLAPPRPPSLALKTNAYTDVLFHGTKLTRFLKPSLSSPKMKVMKLTTVDEDAADSTTSNRILRLGGE